MFKYIFHVKFNFLWQQDLTRIQIRICIGLAPWILIRIHLKLESECGSATPAERQNSAFRATWATQAVKKPGTISWIRVGLFGSKYYLSMQISTLGSSLVSALAIPVREYGTIPLMTLTLTTITSMQLPNKQASRPLHIHTTIQPPSKITVCKIYSSQYQSVK